MKKHHEYGAPRSIPFLTREGQVDCIGLNLVVSGFVTHV